MTRIFVTLTALILLLTACSGGAEQAPPQPEQPPAESEAAAPTPTTPPPTATSLPANTATLVPPTPSPIPPTATAAAEEPASETSEAIQEPLDITELEIVNTSGVDVCDIAVTSSSQEELADNLLDDVLGPDDGLIYADFDPGLYDLLAFDCNDEIVAEEYEIALGEIPLVWFIGEGFEAVEGPVEPDSDEAVAQAPAMDTQTQTGSQLRMTPCPFAPPPAGTVVECGLLSVSENRSRSDSPTIELAVAILRAAGSSVKPDPIIFLDGGPGSSALLSLSDDYEGWLNYPFHQNHDMIFIDQRGTGWSTPSLNCPEVEEGLDNAEQICHDRLVAEGIDLTAYNTAENAADVAALWQTMGYQQVNLFGVSYGTRLGLAVMRDHPQGIRSVVLDSPFPPNLDLPTEEALSNWSAIQVMFQSCLTDDPLCAEAYPNLEAVFLETVDRLNEAPEAFDDFEVTGDDLVDTMVQALYVPELIPLLPRAIYEMSQGEFETYEIVVADTGGFARSGQLQADEDRSDSEGMFTSVTCRDEYAFGDYGRAEARALAELPPALVEGLFYSNSGNLFETCDFWGAGQADPRENEAVTGDIPTLILAGQFDPVTPPDWGRITAQSLSRAYFFELPGFGHSLSSDPGCPTTLITQFFENPEVAPDSSCINEIFLPEFFLPDEPLDF